MLNGLAKMTITFNAETGDQGDKGLACFRERMCGAYGHRED